MALKNTCSVAINYTNSPLNLDDFGIQEYLPVIVNEVLDVTVQVADADVFTLKLKKNI